MYPGASHNRFEHSIGVCHLAGQLLESLQHRHRNTLELTDQDRLCVQIAGLCHDLGHGPFSHLFDMLFIPEVHPGAKWKHEDASVAMFRHMLEENSGLREAFTEAGLSETDMKFIEEQIDGPKNTDKMENWPYEGRPVEKSYLYEIVANKRNGIDVDKWDYLARDSYYLGIPTSFDHKRIMKFARVLEVDGKKAICARDKEVLDLYEMFSTRNSLHRKAYKHKTTKIVERMITLAFVKANDHLRIQGKEQRLMKMSEAINDMVAYTKLTDHFVIQHIRASQDPLLDESKKLLDRIDRRQLFKCVGQALLEDMEDSTKLSKESDIGTMVEESEKKLSAEDIIVDVVKFDYGMKEKNPVDCVWFYSKDDSTKPIKVHQSQVSHMLPKVFKEEQLRVYSTKPDKMICDLVYRSFIKLCERKGWTYDPQGEWSTHQSSYFTPIKTGSAERSAEPRVDSTTKKRKLDWEWQPNPSK